MIVNKKTNFLYSKKYYLELRPKQTFFPDVILENDLILGGEKSNFCIIIEKEDLSKKEFWDFINMFYYINIIKLAKWWNQFFKEIDPSGFFLSKNWSDNYKTRNDWEEWRSFSTQSEILYELYEFPIQIIRVWNRFNNEVQNIWLKILTILNIKKNLLKEIFMDLYDLSLEKQLEISKTLYEYVEKQKKENSLTIQTQETIRDHIKQLRYPLYFQRKKESYYFKKKLESFINLKNLEISIPEDLESKPIELKFLIYNQNDLQNLIEKISKEEIKQKFKELIIKVFEL